MRQEFRRSRAHAISEGGQIKILLLDIETAPNTAYVWSLFKENIPLARLMDTSYVMCWAAKWYGDPEIYFDSTHDSKPKRMLAGIHKMLNDADAVVHYNGTSFDIPCLNREFIVNGLSPPAPYKQVDLLQVVRKQFRFTSNKLDHVAEQLGCGNKHETSFELWVKCMNGDKDAWQTMEQYNRNDVVLLEKVYTKVLPWIPGHPNHGLYDEPGVPVCPSCGSGRLQRRGYARTQVSKFTRWQCQECGTWSREAINEIPKEDRALLMRRDLG